MQERSIPVEQRPQYPAAEQKDADDGKEIACERLLQIKAIPVGTDHTQLPGLHGQCLSTVGPEPSEINTCDHEQVKLECGSKKNGTGIPEDKMKNETGDKQNR